tara:strand:- start:959 stop:2065 length:1107 start_codon:yes stop_codon:yes gene_type:complete
MVSEKKQQEVKELKELMLKYKVISVGDITSLPSKQFQNIRKKLKGKVIIKVTKKRLIKKVIASIKEKDFKPLEKYLEKVMPVLLFTNEDPFRLYKLLKKSKSKAAAKPGQIAPNDLVVEAGPTNFTPGPIIGELGQVGIIASVENGKIAIKKDKVLVKEGDEIDEKKASILAKLGIEPMEIGLNLKVVYDDGTLYEKSVLDFDEDKLVSDIKIAHQNALGLAMKIGYTTKETIKLLISKAAAQAKALSSKINLKEEKVEEKPKEEKKPEEEPKPEEPKKEEAKKEETPKEEEKKEETPKEEPKKEDQKEMSEKDKEMNLKKSDFDKDAEKAQEVIQKLKDEGEVKKHTGEKEKAKPSPIKAEDLVKED